jgi:glycosyltransferase involved in cell wall biosynthesis
VSAVRPLRICLDARLHDGQHGGVQQVVLGLATAFSAFDDGSEEYHFLVTPEAGGWIRDWLEGPCRVLETPVPRRPRRPERMLHTARALAGPSFVHVPRSNGTIERAGIDLMHFTVQTAFSTQVPSVYTPHDLQHIHLPDLFDRRERTERIAMYRRFCTDAKMVVALSSWGKRDIVQAYGLPEDRVQVVPNAPAIEAYRQPTEGELVDARRRLALPDAFLFYPAATWPHKNHLMLLEALAALRDKERLIVPVVCS